MEKLNIFLISQLKLLIRTPHGASRRRLTLVLRIQSNNKSIKGENDGRIAVMHIKHSNVWDFE